MKSFHIDCELCYDVTQQTVFLLNIAAAGTPDQAIGAEAIATRPRLPLEWVQPPGSINRLARIDAPPGRLEVGYRASVTVHRPAADVAAHETPVAKLPPAALPYLMATRYCEADRLFPLASRKFGGIAPGYARIAAICAWIRANVDYAIGTSMPHASAADTLAVRAGVCRDFAHLAIAFCRALNIPARFVTGYGRYAEPPADFHALFEAYLGGRWQLFDPTQLSPAEDLVRIGTGRDASDVAFCTFFGAARLRRLSPLVEPMAPGAPVATLVGLQRPESGIALAA